MAGSPQSQRGTREKKLPNNLRTVEMLAISRAFSCAVVLKIKDGNDICAEALRGSTISGHDADQSLLLSLPRRDLQQKAKKRGTRTTTKKR